MKSLEKALRFALKYYLLSLPLLALYVIPALVGGSGTTFSLRSLIDYLYGDFSSLSDPAEIFKMASSAVAAAMGASLLSFILNFIAYPSTYGMVNKALETGTGDLSDFVPALKQNFAKYLLYWVGNIAITAIFAVIAVVVFIILGLLTSVLKWFGIMLIVLAVLVFLIAGVIIHILLSLWFSIMVVDDMDLIAAFKRSIQISWANFGSLLGVTLIVGILSSIAGALIGFILGWIPVIGPAITSLVSVISTFIFVIFYIIFYRDRTGREVYIQ